MSIVEPGMRPGDLVPGDPDALERLAVRLRELTGQATEAARDLDRLDSAHWSGPAAERFRESIERIPRQLHRAGGAFGEAAQAIRRHAGILRAAQRTAAYAIEVATEAHERTRAWIADGSIGPDPGAEDRERADRLVANAREDLTIAARSAAARLSTLARQAPAATVVGGGMLAVRNDGVTIRTTLEHPLQDADGFAHHTGEATTELRYGSAHHVGFADTTGATWADWAGARPGRETGAVSAQTMSGLAALGAAGMGVLGVAGRARRHRRTAMSVAGLEPGSLRPRRRGRTGSIGGVPARVGRPGSPMWRTNLAEAPRPAGLAAPLRGTIGQHAAADAPVVVPLDVPVRYGRPD